MSPCTGKYCYSEVGLKSQQETSHSHRFERGLLGGQRAGGKGTPGTVTADERLELRQSSMCSEVCKRERDKMMMLERYVCALA